MQRFVRERTVGGVFEADGINNHFPNDVVGRPFQMKKPVMISDKVVDADGHRHSVERFGRHPTILGSGWKAHYFRVVQAFKYVQGLLVVSNPVSKYQ